MSCWRMWARLICWQDYQRLSEYELVIACVGVEATICIAPLACYCIDN